jgi:soluble cytochrome b562
MDEQDFIYFVKQYAMDNYNEGWDEVVEAWDDGDILEYYSDADGNVKKAFKEIKETLKLRREYAEEIRSTAF